MTRHRAPRVPRRSRALLAALVVLALLVAAPVYAFTRSGPAVAATRLAVALTGHFADAASRPDRAGVVAGVASPSWVSSDVSVTSPAIPFSFTAGCDSSGPCTSGDTVSWDFGDGSAAGGTGMLTTTHTYTTPGVYTARARVYDTTSSGEATIKVLVSPRYADADAAQPGKPARPDAEAIWAVSALGLVQPCRTYLGGSTGGQAWDHRSDQTQTDPGRVEFCAEPSPELTPATNPATGTAWAMPGVATTNPVTGASCLSDWWACGLPINAFADHSADAGSSSDGDPTAPCGAACQTELQHTAAIDAAGNLVFDPTDCLSNYALAHTGTTWTVAPGVELGCVSRGEFYTALTRALDGSAAGSAGLTTAGSDVCADGAGADGAGLRRAVTLFGTGTVLRSRGGKLYCDTDAALTKEEAYAAVSKAAGLAAGTTTTLRDLNDETLGHGTKTPDPLAAADTALFNQAGPLIGSSTCADGTGVCFNPQEALTRGGEAELLGALIITRPALVSGLTVQLTTPTPTVAAGHQVQLRATVTVPAYYKATDTVTVTWPAPAGGDTTSCDPTTQAAVGTAHQVTLSCSYSPAHRGVDDLTATVTDARGNTASGALTLTVTNTAPVLGDQTLPTVAEKAAAASTTVSARDAEGNTIRYAVRSCTSTDPAPCTTPPATYPQTGATPTAAWGATANVAVGSVAAAATPTGVSLTVTPADSYANGPYTFLLQACDQDDCSTRVEQGTITPVNDPPVTTALTTVATATGSQASFSLTGSDPNDAGRPGCDTTIAAYRIDSLPAAGTLFDDHDGTFTPAVAGDVVTDATLRWTPPAWGGNYGFAFDVQDTGCPGPGLWSTTAGQVLLQNSGPDQDPTAALNVTPSTVPALTGQVTADASGSSDPDATGISTFSFDWGDGTSTGPQAAAAATHTYTDGVDATHTVTLTVTDTAGNTGTASQSVTVQQNLLSNPTVDADTSSWTPIGSGASVAIATDSPHSGAGALAVSCPSSDDCGTQNTSQVTTTAAAHTATVWVRPSAAAVGRTFTLTLTETGQSGGAAVGSTQSSATLAAGWQKVTVTYTPAAAGDALQLSGDLATYPGSSGYAFELDDASLTR